MYLKHFRRLYVTKKAREPLSVLFYINFYYNVGIICMNFVTNFILQLLVHTFMYDVVQSWLL